MWADSEQCTTGKLQDLNQGSCETSTCESNLHYPDAANPKSREISSSIARTFSQLLFVFPTSWLEKQTTVKQSVPRSLLAYLSIYYSAAPDLRWFPACLEHLFDTWDFQDQVSKLSADSIHIIKKHINSEDIYCSSPQELFPTNILASSALWLRMPKILITSLPALFSACHKVVPILQRNQSHQKQAWGVWYFVSGCCDCTLNCMKYHKKSCTHSSTWASFCLLPGYESK